jgi:ketosteroid isomerase-like protein
MLRHAIALSLLLASAPASADDYAELIAAERDFAAQAQRDGVRAAFLEHLSEDSLGYRTTPVLARALWAAREEPPYRLEWGPSAGEIAGSGDFGYTFGPWRLTPNEPADAAPAHGHFLSVWERDPHGEFRNVFDHGISHDAVALATEATRRAPANRAAVRAVLLPIERNRRLQQLVMADAALAEALATTGGAATRTALLESDIAWFRTGRVPFEGTAAAPDDGVVDARRLASLRIAASGDLALSTGWNGDAQRPVVYARLWRHDGRDWRLAVDYLDHPAPAH